MPKEFDKLIDAFTKQTKQMAGSKQSKQPFKTYFINDLTNGNPVTINGELVKIEAQNPSWATYVFKRDYRKKVVGIRQHRIYKAELLKVKDSEKPDESPLPEMKPNSHGAPRPIETPQPTPDQGTLENNGGEFKQSIQQTFTY